jgi:hypothetical protein
MATNGKLPVLVAVPNYLLLTESVKHLFSLIFFILPHEEVTVVIT